MIVSPKVCSLCRVEKDPELFGRYKRSKDGLRSECKDCRSEKSKQEYAALSVEEKRRRYNKGKANKARVQDLVIEYLVANPCLDCGESDPVVLEFDHVRGEKIANVSELILKQNVVLLFNEIAKCEVVCANCHRRRTGKRAGWYKS